MAEKFYFVEALESGVWRHHHQLIMALVDAKWCIDGKGVDVLPGVVYPFERDEDANYFLTLHESERGGHPRAVPCVVEKGSMVTFWREADAAHFVNAQKARWLTDAEVNAAFSAARSDPVEHHAEAPVASEPDHVEVDALDAPVETAPPKKRGRKVSA